METLRDVSRRLFAVRLPGGARFLASGGVMSDEKRPFKISDEAKRECAVEMFESLQRCCGMKDFQREAAISDLVQYGQLYMDGYHLAKKLDSYANWDCDLIMAEELDGFSALLSSALKDAQREWVKRCVITPPFPVGTAVIARWGGEDIKGTIDEIPENGLAEYYVKRDGELGSTRAVVRFEDVRLQSEAS